MKSLKLFLESGGYSFEHNLKWHRKNGAKEMKRMMLYNFFVDYDGERTPEREKEVMKEVMKELKKIT